MGRKIFISYKYADELVEPIHDEPNLNWWETTARHYVDKLQERLDDEDHINKGEADGEDLSNFATDTIASKLRDKIYDSSITIMMISKGMVDQYKNENEQWIPWEIAYSLRESNRGGRISRANAVLAVVLPDELGSYEHFVVQNACGTCRCRTLKTNSAFDIIKNNMFNIKSPNYKDHCTKKDRVYTGESSYIKAIKWNDFINNVNYYINAAIDINDNIDDYKIVKTP